MQHLGDGRGYTEEDQRADRSFLVGVSFGRGDERRKVLAELDDPICDALMAARDGYYDNLTVEHHLEMLLDRVRGK